MHFCVRIFGQVQEDCVSQGWAFLFSKLFSCFGRGLGLRLGADWRARSTMFAEIWGFSLLEIAVFQRRTMTKRCLSVAHEENAEKRTFFHRPRDDVSPPAARRKLECRRCEKLLKSVASSPVLGFHGALRDESSGALRKDS